MIKSVGSSAKLEGQTLQKFLPATTPTTSTGISSFGVGSSITNGCLLLKVFKIFEFK